MDTVDRIAGVAISLTIAIIFRTYWAIIGGMLASALVQLSLSYLLRPHAPRFTFKSLRKVFGFSGWLAGVSFMAALNNKLDVPILTRLAGTGGAGRRVCALRGCSRGPRERAQMTARYGPRS